MSDLDVCTSSGRSLSPESMISQSSISMSASTQEVSDIDYELDSNLDISLCDSSTPNAPDSKNPWPILEKMQDHSKWQNE